MLTPQATNRRALPTRAIERALLRMAVRFPQWLMVAILAVCLPLQAISTSVSAMLGARHTHRETVIELTVDSDPQDPLREWRESQMQYGDAGRSSHERDHALGLRHHHLPGDPSVVDDDASGLADHAFSSDTGQVSASFLFMAADGATDFPAPSEVSGETWIVQRSMPPSTPDPWRIERPPQAWRA